MELKGFNENELSAQNKADLQSETWKEVRKAMKTEPQHFTAEKADDNSYGWIWNQVVQEYLRTGYKGESSDPDYISPFITVQGVTYKALRRTGVTVFYDADGNTLFDVSHERLEKEYEWLMGSGAGEVVQNMDTEEEEDIDGKDNPIMEQAEADTEIREVPSTERAAEDEPGSSLDMTGENEGGEQGAAPMAEKTASNAQDGRSAKELAEEKLKKELAEAGDKSFAEPIIGYLLERCKDDEGLAEDVVQDHKTWQKCFNYIYEKARKKAKGNCAAVRDDVVYEWAEDYYHKDDKALAASKPQKTAEDKAKKGKPAAVNKVSRAKGSADNVSATPKAVPAEVTQEQPRPKRNSKDMDGQMDMFSMMMI